MCMTQIYLKGMSTCASQYKKHKSINFSCLKERKVIHKTKDKRSTTPHITHMLPLQYAETTKMSKNKLINFLSQNRISLYLFISTLVCDVSSANLTMF